MKLIFVLIIQAVILLSSCTYYQDFNKEKALVFEMNDSSQVILGREYWKGPDDCSATAYMNKTKTGLLITIKVKDDSVRTGNEFSYMNDGVEIYMDLRPPRLRKRNSYERGVFQAVIIPLPGKKNVAPIEWYPKNYDSEVTGASAWTKLNDNSYVVQVFFPYSNLKRNHFWPRTNFSMDIAINDADSVNRETQIIWRGFSDNWRSPANFQPITIQDDKTENLIARKKKSDKPNILFIITDQLTINGISTYGNPYVQTPNMDALASAGIRFTQSYCSSPNCSPSRSSLITGMYPHQTGVNYSGQKPDSSLQNMGQIFRKEGYKTIWGGNWLLPDAYPHVTGADSVPGFSLVDFLSPEKTTVKGNDTDSPLADAMVKQLHRHPGNPWLMVISFQNPQDIINLPSQPDAFLPAVNLESTPPLPLNLEIDPFEPQFLKDCRNTNSNKNELFLSQKFSDYGWRNYVFQYYRMIEKVDQEVGKIIAMLEKQGYDENTLIVFTSDHGDGAAAHRWAGKLSPYEEGIKVPLIVSWFGKEFKSDVDEKHIISGIDILPTMLDYAGISIPSNIEGKSLKNLIDDPNASFREFVFSEIASDPAHPEKLGRMIRYRNYKYIIYSYGKTYEQLFDLKIDPGEMNNLATSSKHENIKNFLRSNLSLWINEKKDYFKMPD